MKYLTTILITILATATLNATTAYNPYHLKGTWMDGYMSNIVLAVDKPDRLDPETDSNTLQGMKDSRPVNVNGLDGLVSTYNDSSIMRSDISYELLPLNSGNEYMKVSPATPNNNTVIVFFHGGAYAYGNHGGSQGLALSAFFGSQVLSIGYDMAPDENRHDLSVQKASDDLDTLLNDLGINRSNVILSGVSAGAGMAGEVYRQLKIDGKNTNFKGIWSWSGWWDLRNIGDTRNTYNNADTSLIWKGQLEQLAKNWLDQTTIEDTNETGSPITQDFTGFPKTMFSMTIKETLSSDSIRAYQKALDANVEAKLYAVDGYAHNAFIKMTEQVSINHMNVADRFFNITQ